MNCADLSSPTTKGTLTALVQNKTPRAPRVSTASILALLSVLGWPVVCVLNNVVGAALCSVVS